MDEPGKLTPILREGIEVVKMVFFLKLRTRLEAKYPQQNDVYVKRLAGAVINELFGTPNASEPFASFCEENREPIADELTSISKDFNELRIPLTDALRTQFLCDSQEGVDSTEVLTKAKDLGILILDRDVPLPAQFIALVRRLGAAFDLLGERR